MSRGKSNLILLFPESEVFGEIPGGGRPPHAGFPSPANVFSESRPDLNRMIVRHPEATFFARVDGGGMMDEGIGGGDLLVVDRALEPFDGCLAVSYIGGEFTLERMRYDKDGIWLVPAGKGTEPVKVTEGNESIIWGVVSYVIKKTGH